MAMAFFAVAYLFLPSHNMTADAISYAADVKYGTDLLLPHHLLYNAFMWVLYKFVTVLGVSVEVVSFMCCVNAIFSLATLAVLYMTIKRISTQQTALASMVFAGSCFGFLRYTLECEVYIPPLFFSMVSSYFFVRYASEGRIWQVLAMGLMASLACLFHQVHLFWGVALFIGLAWLKRYRDMFVFASVTLTVPLVYAVVVFVRDGFLTSDNLMQYIAYYYYTPASKVSGIGFKNLIMSPVSFIRSFIQLHGDIAIQVSLKPYLYVLIITLPVAALFLLYKIVVTTDIRQNRNPGIMAAHVAAFLLQLLFAIYSSGNMEFMVMLPFALLIILSLSVRLKNKYVIMLSCLMLVWNMFFAVIPNHFYNKYATEKLSEYVHEHPDAEVVAYDALTVRALCHLNYGDRESPNCYSPDSLPSNVFVTDILDRPMPFNRFKFVTSLTTDSLMILDTVQTVQADYGTYHLFKVKAR